MKKLVAILFASLLVFSVVSIANRKDAIQTSIKMPKIEINIEDYAYINMPDCLYLHKEGYPILPYYVKTYEFPAGTKINGIEVKAKEIEEIKLNKKIKPAPPAIPMDMKCNKYEIKEGEIYSKDEFYPNEWFSYKIGCGIKDGKRVVFLSIHLYPVRYNAIKNEILYAKDFDLKIDYILPSKPLFTKDEYDLLIICPNKFVDELEPLKEHKESYGIKTIIETTEMIYSKYKGRDEAEKIKYAIKDAIEKYGIKYVMLVGDYKLIPPRYSFIYDEKAPYETSFPSDLYYADIYNSDGTFSSWDTNNNDRFGEYKYQGNTDEVDLYPDVALGRIACGSESEVGTVVSKIINYERSTYGSDWFGKILVCGGDTFPEDNSGVYEGEYLNQLVLNVMSGFDGIKLWASLGNLSVSSIKSQINQGVGFVDFSGHGNEVLWATHPPLSSRWIAQMSTRDVMQLSNGNKLPIVMIDACSCGRFDHGDCFAWKFVEKAGGGGIASLASSGIGYGIPGNPAAGVLGWMEVKFFVYYKQGKEVIGDTWTSCINGYINTFRFNMDAADYKTVEEFILFGDPTLKIGGYGEEKPVVYIETPADGYLYMFGKPLMKTLFGKTIVIGKITIKVNAYNVEKVGFYVDNELKHIDDESPYEWLWNEFAIGSKTIKVIGYGESQQAEDEINIFIINLA